jgi:uncharacterized membrane protein YjdF
MHSMLSCSFDLFVVAPMTHVSGLKRKDWFFVVCAILVLHVIVSVAVRLELSTFASVTLFTVEVRSEKSEIGFDRRFATPPRLNNGPKHHA